MKKQLLLKIQIVTCSLITCIGYAQTPSIEWQKSYGGNKQEYAQSLLKTADGGNLLTGTSLSSDGDLSTNAGGDDWFLVRIDQNQNTLWKTSFGDDKYNYLRGVTQASDGGFVIVGSDYESSDFGGTSGFDGRIMKFNDLNGDVEWQLTLGGSEQDDIWGAVQTSDGGYLLCGHTQSKDGTLADIKDTTIQSGWVIKINNQQQIEWQKIYGGTKADLSSCAFNNIKEDTVNGGYVLSGSKNSLTGYGNNDSWLLKISETDGSIIWEHIYGGSGSEGAPEFVFTSDGGFLLGIASSSSDGDVTFPKGGGKSDYWVVKLDASFLIEWDNSFGGIESDILTSLIATEDGEYVLGGYTYSTDSDLEGRQSNSVTTSDGWLVKINATGTKIWSKIIGGEGDEANRATSAITGLSPIGNGEFIAFGYVSGNNNGNVFLTNRYEQQDYWLTKIGACPAQVKLTKDICIAETYDFNGTLLTETGVYFDTTGSGGVCPNYIELTLTVHDLPQAPTIHNIGNEISVPAIYQDYIWHENGEELTVEEASYSASSDGEYTVIVTDNYGCVSDTSTPFQHLFEGCNAPKLSNIKSYGGSDADYAYNMNLTADGGTLSVGRTKSTDGDVHGTKGDYDYLVIKTNNTGDTLWTRTYGGAETEYGYSVKETNTGDIYVAGYSESIDGDVHGVQGRYDYWVLKLNAIGDTLWTRTYGGSDYDYCYAMDITSDDGCVLVGRSKSTDGDVVGVQGDYDIFIVKIDADGNKQWAKTYGGTDTEYAYSIAQASDGGYIATGYTESNDGDVSGLHGDDDIWVIKLDASGTLVWQKTLGGSEDEQGYVVIPTTTGEYFVAGYTESTDGDVTGVLGEYDYWLVKLDGLGNILWSKTYGGTESDYLYTASLTTDGGLLLGGRSESSDGLLAGNTNQGSYDMWVLKVNANGIVDWQSSFGSSGTDYTYSIRETTGGDVILAGYGKADGDVNDNHGNYDFLVATIGTCRTCSYPSVLNLCEGDVYDFNGTSIISAGIYKDTLQSITGCDSIVGIKVRVNPLPTPVITTNNNELSTGEYIRYEWFFNEAATGETSQTYTEASTGNYQVTVTDTNTCSNTSAVYEHTLTGLWNNDTSANLFEVHPNPVIDRLTISYEGQNYEVSLSNLAGQELLHHQASGVTSINLSSLSPGVFLLKIIENGELKGVQKIVKK